MVSIQFMPGDVEADLLIMCLPGFSTANLLFSPFLTVFTEEGHEVRPTLNGRGKQLISWRGSYLHMLFGIFEFIYSVTFL